jgi:hypothetical protein
VKNNRTETQDRAAAVWGRKSRRLWWAGLGLLGVLAGCSNQSVKESLIGGGTKQVTVEYPLDGFLPHPELLYSGATGQPGLVYFKPGFSFSNYNAILLDPVTIVSDPTSDLGTATAKQRETLANLYYSDLYNALKPHCNLVRRPGPATLRVKFALTDAKTSNGTVKTLATYTPYVMVAYKVGSVAFNGGAGYFSGTATSEAYATDSQTNELLWQGADKRAGAVALIQNTTNSWNDVDNAMKAWSQQVLTRLQAQGACQS